MLCLQSYQELRINRSLVYYPQDRIDTQVIYQFALALVESTVYIVLNNCKQNTTSLSLLVGTTVNLVFRLKCMLAHLSSTHLNYIHWSRSAKWLCVKLHLFSYSSLQGTNIFKYCTCPAG